ncbi:MAG: hypothetical protein HQL11_05890, partial [Candidatus Omnitrophica bacterium]|nr:hypothetical protein [Candidatus Omnitrophota bacterium]
MKRFSLKRGMALFTAATFMIWAIGPSVALAAPEGGQVVAGQGTISPD